MDVEMTPIENIEDIVCSICSNPADPKLDKSSNTFVDNIILCWKVLSVDVKPGDSANCNLCSGCYELLDEISDTIKALNKIEPEASNTNERIIDSILGGIALRKKTNLPFLGIHSKLQARFDKSN